MILMIVKIMTKIIIATVIMTMMAMDMMTIIVMRIRIITLVMRSEMNETITLTEMTTLMRLLTTKKRTQSFNQV